MSRKLLITGSNGGIGRCVQNLVPDAFAFDRHQLDVTDRSGLRRAFAAYRPDVVLHLAAKTDVIECESDEGETRRVNALGTRWVVEAADSIGARVVLVSSARVFGDGATGPRSEWCSTEGAVFGAYGRSKLLAEKVMGKMDTVVRTSWLLSGQGGGELGRNFISMIIDDVRSGQSVALPDHFTVTPLLTADLATTLLDIIDVELTGVVHVTGAEAATPYEIGQLVLELAGLPADLVTRTASRTSGRLEYMSPTLCSEVIHECFTPSVTSLRESITAVLENIGGPLFASV